MIDQVAREGKKKGLKINITKTYWIVTPKKEDMMYNLKLKLPFVTHSSPICVNEEQNQQIKTFKSLESWFT